MRDCSCAPIVRFFSLRRHMAPQRQFCSNLRKDSVADFDRCWSNDMSIYEQRATRQMGHRTSVLSRPVKVIGTETNR